MSLTYLPTYIFSTGETMALPILSLHLIIFVVIGKIDVGTTITNQRK